MEDIQENWIPPRNGPKFHLKYHLPLKTKEDAGGGEPVTGGRRKDTVNKGKVGMQLNVCFVSRDLEPPLSCWCREKDTLTNGDLLGKCKCLLGKSSFRASPVSAVS